MYIHSELNLLIIGLCTLLSCACASVDRPERGNLSDAMELASDNHQGSRELQLDSSAQAPETNLTADTSYNTLSETEYRESPEANLDETQSWQKSVSVAREQGYGLGDYQQQRGLTLRFAGENEENLQTLFYLGYETIRLKHHSALSASVDGSLLNLHMGLGVKQYFSAYGNPLRPYLAGYAGASYLFWTYRNTISTSEGDSISSDGLSGLALSAAAGLEVKPVPWIGLYAELSPKLNFWDETSSQGFTNNAFDPLAVLALSLGTQINF